MFWIATFDTRNALPSLNRQSPHFHDKSLSCGKVQGFSHHGNILIFIIFMSGTGTEKVRQMYRKAAGPSWYRRKFMNSTLEMNLKTDSFGNGSGQFLTRPKKATRQSAIPLWSCGWTVPRPARREALLRFGEVRTSGPSLKSRCLRQLA